MKSFSADDINRIPMDLAVGLMREAFQLLSEEKVQVPLRTTVDTSDKTGVALFMPSYAPTWKLFGLKMVSVFSNNKPPLPSIQGQMLVMDAENGTLLAMLDAPAVTALRTGAASGLATDLLALPECKLMALFGTGAQAWTQVAGVLAVRRINKILVKGTSAEKENVFSKNIEKKFRVSCEPLGDLKKLLDADVICTATGSSEPLFERKHAKSGVHINAIGSYQPHMRELPEDIMQTCRLVVDQRSAVLHEAGEVAIPLREGKMNADVMLAELGEVVAGKSVRKSPDDITVFKSVGNAIQDLAIARYLLRR